MNTTFDSSSFIYLFNTFGAQSTYKIQGKSYDKIISNSRKSQDIKTPLTWHRNVNKQRKIERI